MKILEVLPWGDGTWRVMQWKWWGWKWVVSPDFPIKYVASWMAEQDIRAYLAMGADAWRARLKAKLSQQSTPCLTPTERESGTSSQPPEGTGGPV